MCDLDDSTSSADSKNWIYVGGDTENKNRSKVGKTTKGLHTRHTSSQNPGHYIHTGFNIINDGDVHKIEQELLKHLQNSHGLTPIPHVSTGTPSECFQINAKDMTRNVENFIAEKYPDCVTYENGLHGQMSRYESLLNTNTTVNSTHTPTANDRNPAKNLYFTGNNEQYEIDLGNGFYYDVSSGEQRHRGDDEIE